MPPKAAAGRTGTPARTTGNVAAKTKKASSTTSSSRFAFSFRTALGVFAVANTLAALLSPIQDCDETFNYWEPAHYLLHGYGKQTWEYSPEYAIRDWLYVALHAAVAGLGGLPLRLLLPSSPALGDAVHEFFHGGKVREFYAARVALGLLTAACQARFSTAVARTLNPRVAVFTGLVMVSGSGFFHASAAFLPSAFAMSMGMLGASAFMDWKMGAGGGVMAHGSNAGIMWFGAGAVLGWPFAGALVLPFLAEEFVVGYIAEDLLEVLRRWTDGVIRVMILVSLQLGVNAFFYHKILIVPFNIVMYNIFGGEGRGPEIFGTEPADFYLKNLFLNFNVWFLLSLLAAPILVLQWLSLKGQSKYLLMRSLFFVGPFYMWLAIFSAQPHKEERFMYPAYPFLALNAAVSLHGVLGFIGNADPKTLIGKVPAQLKFLVVSLSVIAAVDIGVFRTLGMITAYRAPLTVYGPLHRPGAVGPSDAVCFGKEWYRFPASFFLPENAHAKFVRSEFDGLLPGDFSEAGTGFGFYPGTWLVPPGMNDMNEFDPSKLVDIKHCSYLIDSYRPGENGSLLEPNYALKDEWEEVKCSPFMDVANTPVLGRLLWLPELPFIPAQFKRKWNKFCLLKRK